MAKKKSTGPGCVSIIIICAIGVGIFQAFDERVDLSSQSSDYQGEVEDVENQAPPAPEPTQEPTTSGPGWQAERGHSITGIKLSYSVTLDDKVDKDELTSIAKQLIDPSYKRTLISYTLKGRNLDAIWASSHADPDLEVKILGIPKGHQWPESQTKGTERKGPWLDEGLRRRIEIIKTKKGWVMESYFTDGSHGTDKLRAKGTRYYDTRDEAVYYEEDGALLRAWGTSGNFATYDPAQ